MFYISNFFHMYIVACAWWWLFNKPKHITPSTIKVFTDYSCDWRSFYSGVLEVQRFILIYRIARTTQTKYGKIRHIKLLQGAFLLHSLCRQRGKDVIFTHTRAIIKIGVITYLRSVHFHTAMQYLFKCWAFIHFNATSALREHMFCKR